jgi:hypothetical protein
LVNAVQLGVAKAAASFQHPMAAPTKEEINAELEKVKKMTATMVKGAILEYMTGSQTAWYGTLGNNDDEIGTGAWTIDQDHLTSLASNITELWEGDAGEWSIAGAFVNLDAPPPGPETCAGLRNQIQRLQDKLLSDDEEPELDINERKKILQELTSLRKQAQHLGCGTI